MHDWTSLEDAGIPSAFVASTEFVDAAEAQSRALGSQPRAVFIAHPIQDRTDDELCALADDSFERLQAALLEE